MKYPRLDLDEYRLSSSSRARFSLKAIRPNDVQGWDKAAAKARLKENLVALDELQERLYAEGERALLIVFQAMDAAGKDSTIEAVTDGIDPQGCAVTNFKAPSTLERAHDFLWRVHLHAPPKGMIGIFNRSHYEDVLIAKVKGLAPATLIEKRYAHINHFEQLLVDHGTRILKVMLHISPEYQLEQFRDRLKTPSKHWKFNPDDLKERAFWDDYMEAYEEALRRCSRKYAPWYVVPAEHKWFRTMVVSELIRNVLEGMDPRYPTPAFDPDQFDPDSLV
ncbi:MAG: polyphosphate kinase 2 family protein [Pseudomonadota bacterium]|nr:polyphosphate kinase 2 family protein [Pseudomonadota bacterium]